MSDKESEKVDEVSTETTRDKFKRELIEKFDELKNLCKDYEASYLIAVHHGSEMSVCGETFGAPKKMHKAFCVLSPNTYDKDEILDLFF